MEDKDERDIIVEKYKKGRERLNDDEINAWEDPEFDIYHATDRYGFIHGTRLPERLPEYETKLKTQENSRLNKWLKMLKSWDQYYPDSEKLKSRTYKGIPNALRGEVWGRLLNISQVKMEQSGKYQEMLDYGMAYSKDVRQIDLDVNRTYRNHLMFRERYNTKQQMLFKVLVAYSVYNSEIGYCQGMSQIAALLLMYMDEEDAFWSMSQLMSDERHAMHGFFIPGFPKLLRFANHHDKIIQKFLPKVWKHFKKFDIDSTLYTLKWFFQCFLDRVPFSLTLRLWDVFLLDGETILTGMSYTLLKLHKRTLLRKSMEETIEFLQIELEKDFGYHDDSAIQALQQSVQELRKYKMLNAAAPADNELPSKPFGILVLEKASLADDQSIAGSIKLKVNDASSVATSRTSEAGSQADLRSISIYDNVSLNESIEAAKQRSSRASNNSKKSLDGGGSVSPLPGRISISPKLNISRKTASSANSLSLDGNEIRSPSPTTAAMLRPASSASAPLEERNLRTDSRNRNPEMGHITSAFEKTKLVHHTSENNSDVFEENVTLINGVEKQHFVKVTKKIEDEASNKTASKSHNHTHSKPPHNHKHHHHPHHHHHNRRLIEDHRKRETDNCDIQSRTNIKQSNSQHQETIHQNGNHIQSNNQQNFATATSYSTRISEQIKENNDEDLTNVQIEETTIIIDKSERNRTSAISTTRQTSVNESSMTMTYISINNSDSDHAQQHNALENHQITISSSSSSTVNRHKQQYSSPVIGPSNSPTNQLPQSPSKIRIFVPFKTTVAVNVSGERQQTSPKDRQCSNPNSPTNSKDLPVVET